MPTATATADAKPDILKNADRLLRNGRPEEALELLLRATVQMPEDPRAHFALAEAFAAQGRKGEAAAAWVDGLELAPAEVSAHLRLIDALKDLDLLDMAATAGCNALLAVPDSADIHRRMCHVYEALGDRESAALHWGRALALAPRSISTCRRYAASLKVLGRDEEACRALQSLLDDNGVQPEHRFLLAATLAECGAVDRAMKELMLALECRPRFPEALNNLGVLMRSRGRLGDAERFLRKAVKIQPDYADAWSNLANLLVEQCRLDVAGQAYQNALVNSRAHAEARTGRALLWLLQGRFEEGWREYEWRWKQPGLQPRVLPQPEWNGEALAGRTILLHAEQGAGDTIQFIRYARLLKQRGARVVAHCQKSLQSLLQAMPELSVVISEKEPSPPFDVHAPMMSLPRLSGTREENIPGDTPYLRVPPGIEAPNELNAPNCLRVGLVWAGNPGHRNDRNRSLAPALLAGVLAVPGVRFFNLQVDRPVSELPAAAAGIVDLAPHLKDYAVSAACIAALDLVITVDTSVAHLAGALGKPVWVLLPSSNDWRWLREREDSPWYPTMRLFRQTTPGHWPSVLARVTTELAAHAVTAFTKE